MMKNCTKLRLVSKQAIFLRLFCLALIYTCSFAASNVYAQTSKQIVVRGKVVDPKGQALQDVLVDVKETLGFVLTDKDGRFTIAVPNENATLLFTLDEYEKATVQIGKKRELNLTLFKAVEKREDRTIQLMYGSQKESRLVSAVETVGGDQLEDIPVMFQNAALAGLMMGVQTIQTTGLPGADNASLYVRGQRSWRSGSPIAFVDGRPRSFSLIDPHEIESISVYKDAGSQSILGLRGANGAFMATTRRGKEGKPVIRFNAQLSISKPTQRPDYLDAYHYAKLYNEAYLNDNPDSKPVYKQEDLDLYLNGESPYTHPNVNWIDEVLKKQTIAQRYNLSIQGGSSKAKYFVNFSYQNNDGLYKTADLNTYNTNANFQVYSVRSNVDVSLTKDLLLSVDLFGRQQLRNNPGGSMSADDLFKTVYSLPANIFPLNYGPDKVAGTNDYRKNPYGILNHSGYSKYIHSTMEASMKANQKLDFITKGLNIYASLAFDARFDNTINRSKAYMVYEYTGKNEATGEDLFTTWGEPGKQQNSNSFGDSKVRIFDVEAGVNYARLFGNKHDVSAMMTFNRNQETTDTQRMANYHQGLFGRASYAFDSRYLAEFSFGYQGTEQLPKEKRYGFFPAVSLGWVLSEEPFIKKTIGNNLLSFVKFYGSYGLTGSDDGLPYFYYLPTLSKTGSGRYQFGVNGSNVGGWGEGSVFNPNVTWEESLKLNIGTDIRLWKDRISLGFNYFKEKTSQILTTRYTVSTLSGYGFGGPLENIGESENEGYEARLSYAGKTGNVYWTVGGNISFIDNKIVFNDEQPYPYDYQKRVGNSINDLFGYVSDGLYKDEQDRLNSPVTDSGAAYAGDIKYRDLNGDGVINEQDQRKIGDSNLAEWNYGFFVGAAYKGFDVKALFTGVADRDFTYADLNIMAFKNEAGNGNEWGGGSVQQYHWDNRYNPNDPSTWQTAKYPRLSLLGGTHNRLDSDFWQDNGSFLRLKTLEIGYTLPQRWTRKAKISKARIFYTGYNLLTWHHMRVVDPESQPGVCNYPVQKVSSFGLSLQF